MRVLTTLAIGIALLVSACAGAEAHGSAIYTLSEFAIEGPSRAGVGSNEITVTNAGDFPHTLVIADQAGTVIAATDLVQPDGEMSLQVDLSAGPYQVTCRIVSQRPNGELVDHFEKGMSATLQVES